ncbi:muscle-specific protein 300 kDa-like [Neocloeon triangulifer]|uniref:muscle-specific protein 300 kDa-like n=1 Tax=Neocloeon triangulifer TaxID=2078957 RepID=UPI00286F0608|nr:muscle-specific protein 300 kDa-like [Neocloeon triangulifer]
MATAPSGCGPSYADVLRGQRAQQHQDGLEEPLPPQVTELSSAERPETTGEPAVAEIEQEGKEEVVENVEIFIESHVPITFEEIETPQQQTEPLPSTSKEADSSLKGETYAQVLLKGARRLLHREHNKSIMRQTKSTENLEHRKDGIFGSQVFERKEVHRSSPMLAPRLVAARDRSYERSVSPLARRFRRGKLEKTNSEEGKKSWKSTEALRKERSVSPFTRVVYKGRPHKNQGEERWKSSEALSPVEPKPKPEFLQREIVKKEKQPKLEVQSVKLEIVEKQKTPVSSSDSDAAQNSPPKPKPRKKLKKSKSEDKPAPPPEPVEKQDERASETKQSKVGTDDAQANKSSAAMPVPTKRTKQKSKFKKVNSEEKAANSQHVEVIMPSEEVPAAVSVSEESAVPEEYAGALRKPSVVAPHGGDDEFFIPPGMDFEFLSKPIITHSNLYLNDEQKTSYSIETEVIHKKFDVVAVEMMPSDDDLLDISPPSFPPSLSGHEVLSDIQVCHLPVHTTEEVILEASKNINQVFNLENADVLSAPPAPQIKSTPAPQVLQRSYLSETSNASEELKDLSHEEQPIAQETAVVTTEIILSSAESTQNQVLSQPEIVDSKLVSEEVLTYEENILTENASVVPLEPLQGKVEILLDTLEDNDESVVKFESAESCEIPPLETEIKTSTAKVIQVLEIVEQISTTEVKKENQAEEIVVVKTEEPDVEQNEILQNGNHEVETQITVHRIKSRVLPSFWLNYFLYRDAENKSISQSLPSQSQQNVTEIVDRKEMDKAPEKSIEVEMKIQSAQKKQMNIVPRDMIGFSEPKSHADDRQKEQTTLTMQDPLTNEKINRENYHLARDAEAKFQSQPTQFVSPASEEIKKHENVEILLPSEKQHVKQMVDAFWDNYNACQDAERNFHILLSKEMEEKPAVEVKSAEINIPKIDQAETQDKPVESAKEIPLKEPETALQEVKQENLSEEIKTISDKLVDTSDELSATKSIIEQTTEQLKKEYSLVRADFWENYSACHDAEMKNVSGMPNSTTKVDILQVTEAELSPAPVVKRELIERVAEIVPKDVGEKSTVNTDVQIEPPKERVNARNGTGNWDCDNKQNNQPENVPIKANVCENDSIIQNDESKKLVALVSFPAKEEISMARKDKKVIEEKAKKITNAPETIKSQQGNDEIQQTTSEIVKSDFWENYSKCQDAEQQLHLHQSKPTAETPKVTEFILAAPLESGEQAAPPKMKLIEKAVTASKSAAEEVASCEPVAEIIPEVSAKTTAPRLDLFHGTFNYDLIALEDAEKAFQEKKCQAKVSRDVVAPPAAPKVEQNLKTSPAEARVTLIPASPEKSLSGPEEAPTDEKEKRLSNSQDIENLFDELAGLVSKYENDVKNLPREELKSSIDSLESLLDEFMRWERKVNDVLADINSHDSEEAPEDLANLQQIVQVLLSSASQGKNAIIEMLAAAAQNKSPPRETAETAPLAVEKQPEISAYENEPEKNNKNPPKKEKEIIGAVSTELKITEVVETSVAESSSEPQSISETSSEVSIHVSADTDADVQLKIAVVEEDKSEPKAKSRNKKRGKKGKEKQQPETEPKAVQEAAKNTPQLELKLEQEKLPETIQKLEKAVSPEPPPQKEKQKSPEPVLEVEKQKSPEPIQKLGKAVSPEPLPQVEKPKSPEPVLEVTATVEPVSQVFVEIPADHAPKEAPILDIEQEPLHEAEDLVQMTQFLQRSTPEMQFDPDEIYKTATRTMILTQNTQVATVTRSVFVGDVPVSEPEVCQVVTHSRVVGEEERLQTEANGKKEMVVHQKIVTSTCTPEQMQGTSVVDIQEITDAPHELQALIDDYEPKSSSHVTTILQQSSRRVVRKIKRIIRRVVIIDGKEQEVEEIVEEPEEMEILESSVPQLSIQYTKETQPADKKDDDITSTIQQEISTQDNTIESSLAQSMSVPLSEADKTSAETTPRDSVGQQSSTGAIPKAQRKKKNRGRKGKERTPTESQETSQTSTEVLEEDTMPNTPVDLETDKSESEQTLTVAESSHVSTPVPAQEIKAPSVKIRISEGSPKVELEICTNLLQEQSALESDVKISCSIEDLEQTSSATPTADLEPLQKGRKGKKGKGKVLVKSITSTVSISNGNSNHDEKPAPIVEVVQKGGKGKKNKGKQKQPLEEQQVSGGDESKSESTAYEIHVQTTVTEETFQTRPPKSESPIQITEITEKEVKPQFEGHIRDEPSQVEISEIIDESQEMKDEQTEIKQDFNEFIQTKEEPEGRIKPTESSVNEAKTQISNMIAKMAYKKMLPKESIARKRTSLILEVPEQTPEGCRATVAENLTALASQTHGENREVRIITILTTVSTWLEVIEYQLHTIRELGDSRERNTAIQNIRSNSDQIRVALATLHESGQSTLEGQDEIQKCLDSVTEQLEVVEHLTQESESDLENFNSSWQELLESIEQAKARYAEGEAELFTLRSIPIGEELLAHLDGAQRDNQILSQACKKIIQRGRLLMKRYPQISIPVEIFEVAENSRNLSHNLAAEKDKALQKIAITEEYKRTIEELAQIIEVAQVLVESPLVVNDREQLQEEMQKHRKFFANLSHCQQLLESLDTKLDEESRGSHAELHKNLHSKASLILDDAACKAQRMALAASRWTFLEQGLKEEDAWLKVALQRVPELDQVTSADCQKYISQYQALLSDVTAHHCRIHELTSVAHSLQELVTCGGLESTYHKHADAVSKLQETIQSNLQKLMAFKHNWNRYEDLSEKVETWARETESTLKNLSNQNLTTANMRYFWELKAQYEVYTLSKNEAAAQMNQAFVSLHVADEMLQRQFQGQLEDRWQVIAEKISTIQGKIRHNLSLDNSVLDKIELMETELKDVHTSMNELTQKIQTEEDILLYIQRLQILLQRCEIMEEELSALGPASPSQLEEVSRLINSSRRLSLQLGEEKEMAITLRDKFSALVKGLAQTAHVQELIGKKLDGCEEKETQTSGAVEQALHDCTVIESDLALQWQKLMQLRQALHSLPLSLRASVSPVGVEREMSSLQSSHLQLEDRTKEVYGRLRSKQHEWRAFDKKLEAVQQSVQETDYMMDLLTVRGGLDYEQLKVATERLERLVGSLGPREELLSELQCAAVPLASTSAPEVRERVEESVASAVSAWHLTSGKVRSLCSRYQDAVHLWQRYLVANDALRRWTDHHGNLAEDAEDLKALAALAKHCEESLPEQEQHIEELLRLSEQITQLLGLEESTSAGLALVKDVETLNKRLGNVRSAIIQLAEAAEKRALEGEVCSDDLKNTRNFLDNVQESLSAVEDLNMKDAEKQLESLRAQLLSLSKAESQIHAIREKSVEINPSSDTENSLCIVEILQLWQQVFRETFQQYHRLSARLVRSQDGAEALRLWQEYLQHVQSFLSTSIPKDYHSLTEHQHLCEVHQNLLSSQQSLLQSKQIEAKNDNTIDLDQNLVVQFSTLTNQHNETLSRIMDRHAQVKSRISAWDKYRTDQTTLLAWLKEMEKDRYNLQLQYVHIQLIPKSLTLIKNLLDKIPEGLAQLDNLKQQQLHLLEFSDRTLAASIQMEHAAITQRINNLQAGLETWRDFLLRVLDLHTKFDQQATEIQGTLNEVKTVTCRPCPTSNAEIIATIDVLRGQRTVLTEVIPNLEELNVVHEQLKECVSPSDAKMLSQRMWLLWQQHGDLDHQLSLLILHLEEKLALKNVFDARQVRFLTWVEDIESRVQLTRSVYPSSLIEDTGHMEREVENEITLKERELNWLNSTGADLLTAENDEERRLKIAEQIQQVQDSWNQLQLAKKTKTTKLSSLQQTFTQLELQISDLRTWLYNMEAHLLTPLVFKSTKEQDIQEKLKEAEEIKKSIEKQSSNLAATLNLFEMFLVDCDTNKMLIDTNPLQLAVDSLEKRWANVCDLSEERKEKISTVWAHLQELERLCSEQEEWLTAHEQSLKHIEERSKGVPKEEVQPLVGEVEGLLEQVAARNSTLQQLEQQYSKMVMESSGSFDNLCEITSAMRQSLARWIRLPQIASLLLSKLRNLQQHNSQFITAHNNAVMALTNVDVKLTQLQHLKSENEPPQQTLKTLKDLEAELDSHNDTFENADRLGLAVMQSMDGEDFSSIQSMIDEYQDLWKSIQKRIGEFRASLEAVKDKPSKKSKKKQRTEQQQAESKPELNQEPALVNESVQVSTLEFETDQAVQVDTLPPLLRLTSKEGYQMELDSALKECAENLDTLQNAIHCTTPQIAEATIAANNLIRLIGMCQSSVDFVKHLSSVLTNQNQATLELDKQTEIQYLIERFNKLLADAHSREQHFRDVRSTHDEAFAIQCEHGNAKLTCPLCTNKNWQQLDNDIWRLEKWLQYAEGTQKSQKTPPSNIEQLEDVIQDNREFLLDLDSHKSIVVSLNIVGTHLADNTEDKGKAEALRARLATMNSRWETVCQRAAQWQTQLQTTLLESREFHSTIDELNLWIDRTENCIRQTEPIDLTEDISVIENKFDKFRELKCELERCEPRVISLQEAAEQLLRHCDAPRGSNTWSRLTDLRLRLQSLRRLCGVYIVKLGAVLGRDPAEFSSIRPTNLASTSLYSLPPLVDQAGASRLSASADELRHNRPGESGDEVDTTVLSRSCQFLGRVVRASLPIQALMLLLLGVAALVPSTQEDFSCTMANTFARSFEPMLRYPNGPPPI